MTAAITPSVAKGEGGGLKIVPSQPPGVDEVSMFKLLCGNVNTSMIYLNNTIQEFLQFKDEVINYALPSNLLLKLMLMSSQIMRSYSDLCTPVGELNRLVQLHSAPWEKKAESLKGVRSDYDSMKRRLNIALKKLEMTAAEQARMKKVKCLGHWERFLYHILQANSQSGIKRKSSSADHLYQSDSDSDTEYGNETDGKVYSSPAPDEVDHSSTPEESEETTPLPPPIVTADISTSTSDPDYDNYLLVLLHRPSGLLKKKDMCCTLALGDKFCTSQVFPRKPKSGAQTYQVFHFPLSEEEGNSLPPTVTNLSQSTNTKFLIGVYPRNVSEDLAANASIPLTEVKLLTEEATVLVPPESAEEEFEIDWDDMAKKLSLSSPFEYSLTYRGNAAELAEERKEKEEEEEEEEEEGNTPLLPMICHRIKVQRHQRMHNSTLTIPLEELIEELGYRKVPDTQSRAASALPYEPTPPSPPTPEVVGPTETEIREEMEKESQEQIAAQSLQHMEDLKELQNKYEEKLNALSKTLARVKTEKSRQIDDLEQALAEMEKDRGKNRGRSILDIQRKIARKKKIRMQGLPEWGKDLPDDFFERLEMFQDESIKKQEELMGRIKKEVSEAYEKRLATEHKLAPGARSDIDITTEDISLPALFMPLPTTKHLVYTPRAHKYFHPPGSTENRVTQPPSVFKLPSLHSGLQTLNLFELSEQFSQTGPEWLKETGHTKSPILTPAPPPSACGYYYTHPTSMPHPQDAHIEEEEEEEEDMNYGRGIR